MRRPLLLLSCALALSATCPIASSAGGIKIWHRHHKDATAKTADAAPKPKAKRSILHRHKPTREDAARSEATYGMTGPKSIGRRHPQPGPAGYGAK
jgi:hypothetical protein